MGIVLLLALAVALLSFAWRMAADHSPSPALAIGIGEESAKAETADAAQLVGVDDSVVNDERVQVAVVADEPNQASDAAIPVEWTLRFGIDRSRLGQPVVHIADASQRRNAYHAAIFLASGKTIEFNRNELAESGQVELSFQHPDFAPLLEGASFVLATCPQGVGMAPHVFFEGGHGRSGVLLKDAPSIDAEARTIGLGEQRLEPVPYLGTVTMEARDDGDSFSAFISSKALGASLLGQFGRPLPGRLRTIPSTGGKVEAYSFGPGPRWSVLLKTPEGDLVGRQEAERGVDITFQQERPSGVAVTVDLQHYADASRVLFVSGDVPLAQTLDEVSYDARLSGALSSNAIPIPKYRSADSQFTTGVTTLDDGRVRVEIWSRRAVGDTAEWKLLHSQSATVAGDVTELNF